jgi:purine-cytosine permease-like protein
MQKQISLQELKKPILIIILIAALLALPITLLSLVASLEYSLNAYDYLATFFPLFLVFFVPMLIVYLAYFLISRSVKK